MADLLDWSNTINLKQNIDRQRGKDLLTESFGQQDAYKQGANFQQGLAAGTRAVQAQRDPLFQLKELQLKTSIAQSAAAAADHYRDLQLTNQKIQFEQEDQNFFTKAAQDSGGDIKAYKAAVLNYSPKSLRGMDEQRIKLSGLYREETHSETTKMFGKLDTKTQLAVKQMLDQNDGEWSPEIYSFAEQSVKASEAAELRGKMDLVDYRTDAAGRLVEQRYANTRDLMQARNDEFSNRLAQKYQNDLKLIDTKDEKAINLLKERYRLANEAGQMTTITTVYPEQEAEPPSRTGWPWSRKDVPGTGFDYVPARRETVKQRTGAASAATGMGDVTEDEYSKLRPDEMFWWNGKQLRKQ